MEFLFTKNPEWLQKWDAYLAQEDKASHLILSDWLRSFASYGFDYEVGIAVQDGQIVGGFGAVIAKASVFRFYIVPYGPIVSAAHLDALDALTGQVPKRGKVHGCCYAHVTLPVSATPNRHVYQEVPRLTALQDAHEGHRFKYVYSSNGLNWVGFKNATDEEQLIESFRASVRRYIRSSQRKGLEFRLLESESDIRSGYELCLENARKNNYALRDWQSFKPTLLEMVASQKAFFMAAFKDGQLKGAGLVVEAGNYNTYILGGTTKEKPDLLVGHFLHWEAIKRTFNQKLSGYNISLGGSEGVVALKNSYADAQVLFADSKFHWVLKPVYFGVYLFVEKNLKSHKKSLSKLLAALRKK